MNNEDLQTRIHTVSAMNDAMEKVLKKIGDRLGVEAGDVPSLLEAIERLTTENGELEACATDYRHEIDRLKIEHGDMNLANVEYEKQIERLTAEGGIYKKALVGVFEITNYRDPSIDDIRIVIDRALKDATDSRPKNCGQCPHDVGDSHERDYDWPNCVDQRQDFQHREWTREKPRKPGYYWWRQGDRIEPCEIRNPMDADLEVWFVGEADPLVEWQWQPEWLWAEMRAPAARRREENQ